MELYSYFRSRTSFILYHDRDSFRVSLFERMFDIQKEAELKYYVSPDRELSHKCDRVLSIWEQKLHYVPILNVEIKFRSSVTDAFKARSYDQIHLKRAYPHLLGVLAYAKPQHSGISFDQARRVCNAFDFFVFVREEDLYGGSVWNPLIECIYKRMESVAKDPSIPAVLVKEDPHI